MVLFYDNFFYLTTTWDYLFNDNKDNLDNLSLRIVSSVKKVVQVV